MFPDDENDEKYFHTTEEDVGWWKSFRENLKGSKSTAERKLENKMHSPRSFPELSN